MPDLSRPIQAVSTAVTNLVKVRNKNILLTHSLNSFYTQFYWKYWKHFIRPKHEIFHTYKWFPLSWPLKEPKNTDRAQGSDKFGQGTKYKKSNTHSLNCFCTQIHFAKFHMYTVLKVEACYSCWPSTNYLAFLTFVAVINVLWMSTELESLMSQKLMLLALKQISIKILRNGSVCSTIYFKQKAILIVNSLNVLGDHHHHCYPKKLGTTKVNEIRYF